MGGKDLILGSQDVDLRRDYRLRLGDYRGWIWDTELQIEDWGLDGGLVIEEGGGLGMGIEDGEYGLVIEDGK